MWSFSPRCIRLEILIVFKVMDVRMCMCTFVRLLLLKLNNRSDAVMTVAVCIVSGPLHLFVVRLQRPVINVFRKRRYCDNWNTLQFRIA